MKKTLSALLAMFLSLNLFVSAVPVLETHVEAASEQTESAEETTLAEDGITYMWDFEDASSQVWKCNNQGYSITYEDGKMKVAVDPEKGYLNHPDISIDTAKCRYLVIKAKSTSDFNEIIFYYKTTNQTWSESHKVTLPIRPNDTEFREYYLDMQAVKGSLFTGNYINCMLCFHSADKGTVEIEDISFRETYTPPVEEVDPEWYYPLEEGRIASHWGGFDYSFPGDGSMIMTIPKDGGASFFDMPSDAQVYADHYPYLVLKAKGSDVNNPFYVYYSTSAYPKLAETQKLMMTKLPYSDGEYRYYSVNLGAQSTWSGLIGRLMLSSAGEAASTLTVTEMYYAKELKFIDSLELTASSDSITDDMGTVLLTPVVKARADVDPAVTYTTDSVNATLTKNEDGTATVTGMIDGTITVTAYLTADPTYSASKTITISGQNPRISTTQIRYLTYGNSIMKHGPNASLGWSGNWGMAASSEDKDYLHRILAALKSKYGENNVVHQFGTSQSNWENGVTANDAVDKDYSYMIDPIRDDFRTFKPNIITLQMGENGAGGISQAQYENIMRQVVTMFKEEAPDATIVITTPFWGGNARVYGAMKVADELGVRIALLHTLNTDENKALGLFEHYGVSIHPGDLGMENIAKLFYAEIEKDLSEREVITYTNLPVSLEIVSEKNTITTENGTLALSAKILPADADQSVDWSVDNNYIATIDENGVLTALNDGVVTVRATAHYNKNAFDEIQITISGQTSPFTVTYDKNTSDTVTGMPHPNPYAKGEFVFDKIYPERETYTFVGWALAPDGEAVSSFNVTENTTVYAVWTPAVRWTFDRTDYKEGFTVNYGFNQYVKNGIFSMIATNTDLEAGAVLQVNSPKLAVDPNQYSILALRLQNSAIAKDTTLDLTVYTAKNSYSYSVSVTTTDVTSYAFDLSNVKEMITGFSFKPTNIDCSLMLDEIAFVSSENGALTYDANTTDTVTNLPSPEYLTSNGKYTFAETKPARAGYTFLGWSKSKTSKLLLSDTVDDSVHTVYAVWDKNDHWEMDSTAEYSLSNGKGTLSDGILHFTATAKADNSYDPIIGIPTNFAAATTSGKVVARMKWSTESTGDYFSQMFFKGSDAQLSEGNSVKTDLLPLGGRTPEDYQLVTFDFTGKENWKGTMTQLRFDIVNTQGSVDLDYVRFTDSEANILTDSGKVRVLTSSDDATYIVKEGGTLAPAGTVFLKNLYLSGDIDYTDGAIAVTDTLEIADEIKETYTVFTLDMASAGVTASDYMYIGAYDKPVEMKDGAKYLVKLDENGIGFVYFGSKTDVSKKALYKITASGAEKLNTVFTESDTAVSVRGTAPIGVRFRATVMNKLLAATEEKDGFAVKEYGFLVSVGSRIDSPDDLNMAAVKAGQAIKGVAHDEKTNIVYESTDEVQMITAVLNGIPNTKQAYRTDLYVRPYVILSNGITVYGNPVTDSMYEIATRVSQTMTGSEPYADYIYNIIEVAER